MTILYSNNTPVQLVCKLFFTFPFVLLFFPVFAQTGTDTMLLGNPNYFINIFHGGNDLFKQDKTIEIQEWVHPKLRDSLWQHLQGNIDEAATYSKKVHKKKVVRLAPGQYKLVKKSKTYSFSVNKNGQIDGT